MGTDIIFPILTLTILGVIFGVGLAIASKKLCVAKDPRIEKIYAKLPGANCGACGQAGCIGFAEALINGTCTIERCILSKDAAQQEIAEMLELKLKKKVKAPVKSNG